MRTHAPLLLLLLACAAAPALAGDVEQDAASADLATDVAEAPLDLRQAVARISARDRTLLRARFAHDTSGRLVLHAVLRVETDGEASYQAWIGPVNASCWAPRRQILRAGAERAEAERLDALVREAEGSAGASVLAAVGPKTPGEKRTRVAIAVTPRRTPEGVRRDVLVAVGGRYYSVEHDPDSGLVLATRPVAQAPARVPVDAGSTQRTLPELAVPQGTWVHAAEAPTLASLRGRPALIAVADPG